jgi:hypothetical protein
LHEIALKEEIQHNPWQIESHHPFRLCSVRIKVINHPPVVIEDWRDVMQKRLTKGGQKDCA